MTALGRRELGIIVEFTPDNEFGINPQLEEFAPSPQGVVLAVTAPKPLEGRRMLPVIWFTEKGFVARVFAVEQPIYDLLDRADRDATLASKIPIELLTGARGESRHRRAKRDPLPGI